jgi:glycosyltransferase involved in cell wall biosynthesis
MGVNYQYWNGFTDSRFGYGEHWRGFTSHLPDGVVMNPQASVNVHMGVPMSCKGWLKGQYRVLNTMWESDTLPSSFKRYLPLYDMIVVPNEIDQRLFSQHHDNVRVVPLGIDQTEYFPTDVPRHVRFQFRAGGSLWWRKGLDVVVKAFNKLNLPDADLRIKAAPHASDVPKEPLGPNVYLDRQWMTHQEKCEWFAAADCFAAASRGEGFGLMPLQTIAMGIPTIVSRTTGQIQFSHLATGQIDCGKSPAVIGGRWDEPNFDQLCEAMLDHYRNRNKYQAQARADVHRVDEFSWDKAVQKMLATLPEGRLLDTDEWVDAAVFITVRALKNVEADIGRDKIRIAKGEIARITDGQYQVLYDAGVVVMA